MAQTIPAAADLGPLHAAKAIGFRVLNLDETVYSVFSTTGVVETNVLGFYRKDNGAVSPDAGGYIVWGVSGTDYAEDTIPPAAATAAQINTEVDTALADVGVTTTVTGRIDAAITSRSTLTAQQVWEYSTRTLSSFGTLIADIWSNAIRTITGGSLTIAPPTVAQIDTQLSGTHGAGAWSTATGFATPANVTDAQTAITAAQPSTAAVVSAIMAYALETGKTFEQAMLNIWSVTAGDSVADDAEYPTSIVYDDPTGAANVTHTLTDTTRVAS